MCAWKRGVNNNQAGEIRRGQIREFLQPSSKDVSVSHRLKIIDSDNDLNCSRNQSSYAIANFYSFPDSFQEFVSIDNSLSYLHLHAHEHPTSVITCISDPSLPLGCILLNEAHRVNSKVCIGENEEFTVYQGEQFTYDAREVSIGDTQIRSTRSCPNLDCVVFDIMLKHPSKDNASKIYTLNAQLLKPQLLKYFLLNILTVEEVFSFLFLDTEYVISVIEVRVSSSDNDHDTDDATNAITELNDEDDEEGEENVANEEYTVDTPYRGIVTSDTKIYIKLNEKASAANGIEIINNTSLPPPVPLKNVVYIQTSDLECFPVKRCLLRPCLALTVLVQSGRGKYATAAATTASSSATAASAAAYGKKGSTSEGTSNTSQTTIETKGLTEVNPFPVHVDACTFDRVLLYLEHEMRHEVFHFDPLIVNELREAAITLKIIGLIDICDKVLGSFQARVRTTPIRYAEVVSRNQLSTQAALLHPENKRPETWILLSGMVLDISRWLDEHPGGSTIIPQQSLNVDSSVFFEIYHASKQSYLYLREFYIGELAEEDWALVPLPSAAATTGDNSSKGHSMSASVIASTAACGTSATSGPSAAFQEQLAKYTAWRLKPEDMNLDYKNAVHKSF